MHSLRFGPLSWIFVVLTVFAALASGCDGAGDRDPGGEGGAGGAADIGGVEREAGVDAVIDGADARADAAMDAHVDARVDAAVDAMADATADAVADASSDAMLDATAAAMTDASADAMTDAALDGETAPDAAPDMALDPDANPMPPDADPTPVPAGTCQNPVALAGPGFVAGTTIGAADEGGPSCAGGSGSPDAVFTLTVNVSQTVCLSTAGSTFDTALHVRGGACDQPDAEIACNDDAALAGGDGYQSALDFEAEPGTLYHVFVDGYFDDFDGMAVSGDFVLEWRPGPCEITGDLIDELEADGRFETLLAVLDAADLTALLREPGPLTLFAPGDAAFEALAVADPLLLPALLGDPARLAEVLSYHLIAADLDDDALRAAAQVETLDGRPIRVEVREAVVLNGIARAGGSMEAANGRFYLVDRVLIPPAPCIEGIDDCGAGLSCGVEAVCLPPRLPVDVLATLRADGRFATLLGLIDAAGLGPTLQGRRRLTLFAPTDAAFAVLAVADPEAFAALQDVPATRLRALLYHIVEGDIDARALAATDLLVSRNVLPLPIGDGGATVAGAPLEGPPVVASNGFVHVIEAVLAPPMPSPIADCSAPVPIAAPGFFVGRTSEGEDQAQASCGGRAESADTTFALALAEGGPVCLSTRGSAFDTVLHVRAGECNAPAAEVACSDDAAIAGAAQSAIDLEVEAGSTYFVIVDGASDAASGFFATGDYILEVRRGLCDPPRDLIGELRQDGRFEVLLDALATAGLDARLREAGPWTLFAPTDAAFAALIAEDAGLWPAVSGDPAALAAVLGYHLVDGDLDPAAVAAADQLVSVEGRPIRVEREGAAVVLNQVATIGTSAVASNGWLHAIDAVLLPPEVCGADGDCEPGLACAAGEGICLPSPLPPLMPAVLAADGRFVTLLGALAAAGLLDLLAEPGPWTLFAPTDEAFAALGADAVQALFDDPVALDEVLRFHLVPGRYDRAAVMQAAAIGGLVTEGGLFASVMLGADGMHVGGAPVVALDLAAANGVVHAVGAVMLPIDACAAPGDLALGMPVEGSTADAADRTQADCGGGLGDGPEIAHRFVVEAPGPVCLSTDGSSFDTILYVTAAECGGAQLACNDDVDFLGDRLTSALTFEAEPGVDYFVFVATYDALEYGAYRLEATAGACPAP